MIPKPHHRQYYWKAEAQRCRCKPKMLDVLDTVDKLVKGKISAAGCHYFYQRLLSAMGFDGSCEESPRFNFTDDLKHEENQFFFVQPKNHPWRYKAIGKKSMYVEAGI